MVAEWDSTKVPLTSRLGLKGCFCREQLETNQGTTGRKTQKGALKQQQQQRKEQMELQKKENEFKKLFQVIPGFKILV